MLRLLLPSSLRLSLPAALNLYWSYVLELWSGSRMASDILQYDLHYTSFRPCVWYHISKVYKPRKCPVSRLSKSNLYHQPKCVPLLLFWALQLLLPQRSSMLVSPRVVVNSVSTARPRPTALVYRVASVSTVRYPNSSIDPYADSRSRRLFEQDHGRHLG